MKALVFTASIIVLTLLLPNVSQGQPNRFNRGWYDEPWLENYICGGIGNHRIHHTVPDGEMGAWVVFSLDLTLEDGDEEMLYVQHIDSTGYNVKEWWDGIRFGWVHDAMYYPDVLPDDSGGIILAGIRHHYQPGVGWQAGACMWNIRNRRNPVQWYSQPWSDGLNYLHPVQIATDMNEGVWVIAYNDTTMFMKHVLEGGTVVDTGMGIIICESVHIPLRGDQPEIISDGAGGCYVAWMDFRKAREAKQTAAKYNDLWMQHVDANGTLLWGDQGIPIDTTFGWHSEINLLPDGTGGVYVVYYNNLDSAINIQRIDAAGNPVWSPPVVTATHLMQSYDDFLHWDDVKLFAVLSEDNEIMVVTDEQNPKLTDLNRSWFQRVTSTGHLRWNNQRGVNVDCSMELDAVSTDDSGGVYVARHITKDEISEIVVQRRRSDGVARYPGLGRTVFVDGERRSIAFSDYQTHKRTNLVPDSRGGVIGVWAESQKIDFNKFLHSMYAFRTNVYGELYPVELTLFTAELFDESVLLNWHTESETNNHGFTIERSLDSEHWVNVGFVAGNGSTTQPIDYSHTDYITGILPVGGTLYYRLKQSDFDGTFEYSDVVRVEIAGNPASTDLHVYPNPSNGNTSVAFHAGMRSTASIEIYNSLGQLTCTKTVVVETAGPQTHLLPTATLKPGVYLCLVRTEGMLRSQQLVITGK